MFLTKLKYYCLILLLIILFTSCSEYQKVLKSNDLEFKFEKAIEYYEEGEYHRARTLLEDLRSYYRGTEKAEKINYYNAYCHYGTGELTLAAYLFREFSMTFPNSTRREEAEYMAAYCYYLLSPPISLDQVFTKRAIQELQLFLERYSKSERRDTVNIFIDELQEKLELKAYNNAYLYYKISSYRAAVTALNNVLIDYPDTVYREEILFYILKSNYEYAENSVLDKQEERYKDVIQAYYNFVDNFPESSKIREAERIYNNSTKFIKENYGL